MKYQEYSEIISKTAIYPKEVKNFGVAYCFLGIYDELHEYHEKVRDGDIEGAKKEKGDVFWYIAALCNELDISFTILMERYKSETKKGLVEYPNFYYGHIKKFYRDNKQIDRNHIMTSFMLPILERLLEDETDESIASILQQNYDKLIKRRETNTIQGDGDNRENENS